MTNRLHELHELHELTGREGNWFKPEFRRHRVRLERLRAALEHEFAELNGWTVSRTAFSLRALRDGMLWSGDPPPGPSDDWGLWDHCIYLRDKESRRAAAIAAQPYMEPSQVPLPGGGLETNTPSGHNWSSFHCPGHTLFVVVTGPPFQHVRWLPEQMEFGV